MPHRSHKCSTTLLRNVLPISVTKLRHIPYLHMISVYNISAVSTLSMVLTGKISKNLLYESTTNKAYLFPFLSTGNPPRKSRCSLPHISSTCHGFNGTLFGCVAVFTF